MPAPIHVRPATPDDAEAVCAVHVESVRVSCAKDYSPEQIAAWVGEKHPDAYRAAIARRESLWVAERQGHIVGMLWMAGDEVKALYVHPQHARCGAGRALLSTAEDHARRSGFGRITLTSTLTSIDFYARCGFANEGLTTHRLSGGVEVACVRMTKRLR